MNDPWQSAGPKRDTGAPSGSAGRLNNEQEDSPSLFPDAGTDGQGCGRDEGHRRRDEGQRAVLANTHVGWRLLADRVIAELAATGEVFTAETVRTRTGHPLASHDNAFGGIFAAARRAGVIEPVGYTTATRPEAAGRVIRTWRGTGKVAAV